MMRCARRCGPGDISPVGMSERVPLTENAVRSRANTECSRQPLQCGRSVSSSACHRLRARFIPIALCLWAVTSWAQTDTGDQAPAEGVASTFESGFKFTLQEQSEVWANLFGGGQQGTTYNGLTTASLDLDLDKSFGWKKGRFFVSTFDIHGHGPTRSLVGNNQILSNIEAAPSFKLYDLWLEQRLFGVLYLRIGQEGANDEMMTSPYDALFLNSSFGFPGLPAADLPSGGPNYPLATPFVRARWKATDKLTMVGAVYNGDPAPPGSGDPQIRDRHGTAFRLNGGSLSFAEF